MKSVFVSLLAVVAASSAQAEVKRPGSFVPSLCSVSGLGHPTRPSIVAVKEACIGKIAGSEKDALEVLTNDGEKRVYEIKIHRAPGRPRMGENDSPFEGSTRSSRVRDEVEGVLTFTTGMTTSWQLQFKTTSNLKFQSTLQEVFVTQ
jgi:hypothetical protein